MEPCMRRNKSATLIEGGPILADIFLPKSVPHGGLILASGDHFWQPKSVRPDQFWQQKWSGGGPVLADFSAKISPAGPILGGTDFGVTDPLRKRWLCLAPPD